jgi:2Fe-2S ferredoxin
MGGLGFPRDDGAARGAIVSAEDAVLEVTWMEPDGGERRADVPRGTSLLRAAILNGVPGIVGECGGQAMCATCHVYVRDEFLDELAPIGEDEDEMLESTTCERTERSRLSCQIISGEVTGRIIVDVPERQV